MHTSSIAPVQLSGPDHLRALAITLVFFYHYQNFGHPDWPEEIIGLGWMGVDLFFVLSGFLIAGQIFRAISKGRNFSLKEFFIKRIFRIIPAYLVVLILYIAMPIVREREHLAPIWQYLTFTLNLDLDLSKTGTFTHAWSLCIEEQFYLILPLIVLLINYFKLGKKSVYIFAGLFILGFALRLWSWDQLVEPHLTSEDFWVLWYKYIYYPTYNRLDGLLTGVGIAAIFTFYPLVYQRINEYANWLLLFGVLLLLSACFLCIDPHSFNSSIFGFPLIALAFGAIVASAVCPKCILYTFKSKFTFHLATLSYSIYLIHKIMIYMTQNLLAQAGLQKESNLMLIFCIATSLSGAVILRYCVELPFLSIKDKILNHPDHCKI